MTQCYYGREEAENPGTPQGRRRNRRVGHMAYMMESTDPRVSEHRLSLPRTLHRVADQAAHSAWGALATVVLGFVFACALLFLTDVAGDAKPGIGPNFVGAMIIATFLAVQLVVSSRKKRQNKQTELAESENLDGCDLTSIDLSRTSMRNKPMYSATLSEVTAFNADFHGAELVLARLNRGTFGGASFRQADLKGASCVDADFRGADFVGAHCRSINLRRADLRDATMGDIDLTKARLQGADFRGCVLDDACVKGARYDRRTRFPEGFDPVSSGMRETPDER